MADAGFFKGTSAEQDSRFANKQKKLLQQMKFPDNINIKIDMIKVNLDVMKPWITKRLQELLGIEDDVVIEFVFNQLEDKHPDPKMMQINLTGFLGGSKARLFIGELWKFLASAQTSPDGIPIELVELKKKELLKKQEDDDRLREIRKREEESQKQIVKVEVDKFDNRTNGYSSGTNRRRSPEKTRSQQEKKAVRSNNENENVRRKSPVRKPRTPSPTSSSEDEKIERKKEKTKKRSPSNSNDERIEKKSNEKVIQDEKSKKSKRTRSVSVSSSGSSSSDIVEIQKSRKKTQSARRRSRSRSSSNHRHKKSRKQDKSSSRKHRHHSHKSKQKKTHRHDSTKKKHSKSPDKQRSLSPKKPRLESQIRVQTPPPQAPNRAERIVVLEESRADRPISQSSHEESSEIHHSSEDENEIDLRERLLREKAIKSMKRRQTSSLSNDNSSKSLITERIVYQTQ